MDLVSTSAEISGNFVAVDLIDYKKAVAYQVTSRDDTDKIKKTIDKFNNSEEKLYKYINELNILVLNSTDHKYRSENVSLKNGREFSYTKNIMNLKKLIGEIEMKNLSMTDGFIIKVYDMINMVYDSGRLKYSSIVKETQALKKNVGIEVGERLFLSGGDVSLSARIPKTYKDKLYCELEMRQHNLSGVFMTIDQETILRDYFVSEEEFEHKHNIGRCINDEYIWMQLQNIRICLNAHTAYNLYKLFDKLKNKYEASQSSIDDTLGTKGLHKEGAQYLLMTLTKKQWKEILFFADAHDWCRTEGEAEWNIFNNSINQNNLILSPNVNGAIRGDILAELHVELINGDSDKLNLYWKPGWKNGEESMNHFDNIVKWKADYTQDWIVNKLLDKAHEYYASASKHRFGKRICLKRKK